MPLSSGELVPGRICHRFFSGRPSTPCLTHLLCYTPYTYICQICSTHVTCGQLHFCHDRRVLDFILGLAKTSASGVPLANFNAYRGATLAFVPRITLVNQSSRL